MLDILSKTLSMSIWQTQSWQDMLITSGQSEEYFVVERDIKNIERNNYGPIFVEKRQVSMGEYGLFVIGFEGELDADMAESLVELCKEENCLFVQVETIDYSMQPSSPHKGEEVQRGGYVGDWKGKYYKKFIPPYTAVIDLTKSQDDILAAMKPKGRYNIRLAEKKGVVVEQVDTHSHNIKKFYDLMSETTSRDNFAGNTLEFYTAFLEGLTDSQLFFAYHEDELIAAGIFVSQGEVMTYYYGASSNHKRNLMAPYLLQWRAICHAKKRGLGLYDFLGVAGPDETNSPLAGVTDFKRKLTPDIREVSTSFLYVHKMMKYALIGLLKKLRK